MLLAEVDGSLVAAVSTRTGEVVSDPFVASEDVVALLRFRATQLDRAACDTGVRLRSAPVAELRKVGVVGLGAMGAGIAQLCVEAGLETVGREVTAELGEQAKSRIGHFLTRKVEKGTLGQADRDEAVARLSLTTECRRPVRLRPRDRGDRGGARAEAEALHRARASVPGRRRARHQHLGAVGHRDRRGDDDTRACGRHALLQPGAPDAARRGRAGAADGDSAFETAYELGLRLGKTPVRCHDTPGFIVNRVLIPLLNDCIRILDEARVTPEDLDAAMKNGAGWPMGPCELADLVGIDVHVHAAEALYAKLREPRMAPPPRLVAMLNAGLLGRKSGSGFYRYDGR